MYSFYFVKYVRNSTLYLMSNDKHPLDLYKNDYMVFINPLKHNNKNFNSILVF